MDNAKYYIFKISIFGAVLFVVNTLSLMFMKLDGMRLNMMALFVIYSAVSLVVMIVATTKLITGEVEKVEVNLGYGVLVFMMMFMYITQILLV